jgi:hypothetical protein
MKGLKDLNNVSGEQKKHSKSQTLALLSTVKIIWKTTRG